MRSQAGLSANRVSGSTEPRESRLTPQSREQLVLQGKREFLFLAQVGGRGEKYKLCCWNLTVSLAILVLQLCISFCRVTT